MGALLVKERLFFSVRLMIAVCPDSLSCAPFFFACRRVEYTSELKWNKKQQRQETRPQGHKDHAVTHCNRACVPADSLVRRLLDSPHSARLQS